MQAGQGLEAAAVFQALIASHPSFPSGRLNLATAWMHQGNLAAAVDLLRQVTADEPANAEAFYNLGVALKQRDDFEPAEAALRRAVTLAPRLAEAPFTLGVLLWQTGRVEDAEAAFREAISRNPDSADAHYMLGTVLRQQRRSGAAIEAVRTAIRLRPDLAEAHQTLAQLLTAAGDAEGARAAQARAETLNQRTSDVQASAFALGVGRQKLKAGDRAAAIAQFREALRLAADNAQAHYALALALEASGAVAEARRHFAEAARLSPALRRPETPK